MPMSPALTSLTYLYDTHNALILTGTVLTGIVVINGVVLIRFPGYRRIIVTHIITPPRELLTRLVGTASHTPSGPASRNLTREEFDVELARVRRGGVEWERGLEGEWEEGVRQVQGGVRAFYAGDGVVLGLTPGGEGGVEVFREYGGSAGRRGVEEDGVRGVWLEGLEIAIPSVVGGGEGTVRNGDGEWLRVGFGGVGSQVRMGLEESAEEEGEGAWEVEWGVVEGGVGIALSTEDGQVNMDVPLHPTESASAVQTSHPDPVINDIHIPDVGPSTHSGTFAAAAARETAASHSLVIDLDQGRSHATSTSQIHGSTYSNITTSSVHNTPPDSETRPTVTRGEGRRENHNATDKGKGKQKATDIQIPAPRPTFHRMSKFQVRVHAPSPTQTVSASPEPAELQRGGAVRAPRVRRPQHVVHVGVVGVAHQADEAAEKMDHQRVVTAGTDCQRECGCPTAVNVLTTTTTTTTTTTITTTTTSTSISTSSSAAPATRPCTPPPQYTESTATAAPATVNAEKPDEDGVAAEALTRDDDEVGL